MAIQRNRTTPQPTRTTGASGAASTTATTATTNTTAAATPAQPAEIKTASGQIVKTVIPAITGLAGKNMNATSAAARTGGQTSQFDNYVVPEGDAPVSRGFIRPDATPIAGGFRLNVKTFHRAKNEKLDIYLTAEILDTKTNQLRPITLAVLSDAGLVNKDSHRGDLYFDIRYDDINKFLQSKNPNLKVTPGVTNLAVSARWQNGHQAGGFGRGGVFRLPTDSAQTVNGVRAARGTSDATDLPLDMQVAFPAQLTTAAPALKPNGNILSRLESELKGEASKAEMTDATKKMYALVAQVESGDHSGVKAMLGPDWTIETVNRYWVKDDGESTEGKAGTGYFKGFRVDDDGLPIQDPMRDTYMDDGNLGMTQHEGAVRLRANKQATVMNVKPGGGKRDDNTAIAQRVEYGLEMNAGTTPAEVVRTMATLNSGNWQGTVFNAAQRGVSELDRSLNLQNTLNPWLDVVQDRHKFTVKNEKTGVEVELSFDSVKAKTLRPEHANADGTPRTAEFYVLEAELDHLQLQSTNTSTYAAAGAAAGGAFTTDSQQDTWLKTLSDNVTLDIDPRLHELDDLENKSFRSTASYTQFEGVSAKLLPALFPKGLGYGRQKAAHAADVMNLIHFDDKAMLDAAKEVVVNSGFKWSGEMRREFGATIKGANKRKTLQAMFTNGTAVKNPLQFIQAGAGNIALEYDTPRLKERVADHLQSIGFESTPEIEKLIGKVTTANVPPANLSSFLQRMSGQQDAAVMTQFARAVGESTVPVPLVDAKALIVGIDAQLKTGLKNAWVDDAILPELTQFMIDIAAKGATVTEMRNVLLRMSNGQSQLEGLATKFDVKAPVLKASSDAMLEHLRPTLTQNFFQSNKALEGFLDTLAERYPLQQATQQAQSLRNNNVQSLLDQQAKALGVASPQLSIDMKRVNTTFEATLKGAMVSYDAPMKTFAKEALELGIPVNTLNQLFSRLGNTIDMKSAMQAQNIFIAGINIPTAKYDFAAAKNYVITNNATYQAAFGPSTDAFIQEALDKGATPQKIYQYVRYLVGNGRTRAEQQLGLPPALVPKTPAIDAKAFAAHAASRHGANWKPEYSAYVEKALPKAFELMPNFRFQNIYSGNPTQILTALEQASKLPKPA